MMIRGLILLLTLIAATLNAGWALAQSSSNNSVCLQAFAPLREEAEGRGRLIMAASERHAPPEEACRLEANSAECGVPQRTADQIKAGHLRTEALRMKVCAAGQQKRGPIGDFDDITNISLPARSRGPTFGPAGPVGDFDKVR